jgi:HNH endonuclease
MLDRSPRWTDAHHIRSWTRGGGTDLANLVLLCRHHHRLIHEGDWTVRIAGDGLPEFLPPPVLGQPQPPRRNPYHRRT